MERGTTSAAAASPGWRLELDMQCCLSVDGVVHAGTVGARLLRMREEGPVERVAEFAEIVEPERIVYTDAFSDAEGNINEEMPQTQSCVDLEDAGGRIRLTMRATYPTEEDLRQVLDMGMVEAITETLDHLDEHLDGLVEYGAGPAGGPSASTRWRRIRLARAVTSPPGISDTTPPTVAGRQHGRTEAPGNARARGGIARSPATWPSLVAAMLAAGPTRPRKRSPDGSRGADGHQRGRWVRRDDGDRP